MNTLPGTSYIFDTSAIAAVFDARGRAYQRWQLADAEDSDVIIAFPVGAMLDAARDLGIRASAWDGPTWSPNVLVLPLGGTVAKEIGGWPGPLGVRHTLFESGHLDWPIVTGEPGLYPAGTPLLTF